jgi:uncharacterized protein DUF1499
MPRDAGIASAIPRRGRRAGQPSGSRIDIRSHGRQGRGDLGVNAARIRGYLAAMKGAIG